MQLREGMEVEFIYNGKKMTGIIVILNFGKSNVHWVKTNPAAMYAVPSDKLTPLGGETTNG